MINVVSLSLGFCAFFILWRHASTELKTDQQHTDADLIARVVTVYKWKDEGESWGQLHLGYFNYSGMALAAGDFPQIDLYCRTLSQPLFSKPLVGHGHEMNVSIAEGNNEHVFHEQKAIYADPNLFAFFSIPLLSGDKDRVLASGRSVVLSKQLALKYFGDKDPIGKTILINQSVPLIVTGVFRDLPHHTHLDFDMVISNIGLERALSNDLWDVAGYFKVKKDTDFKKLEEQLNAATNRYWPGFENERIKIGVLVQPLTEIAFGPRYWFDSFEGKSKTILRMLQIVSLIILAMSWINYTNLHVARIMKRFKEIGARKVTGALPRDFAKQFLIESAIVHALAVGIALTVMQLIRIPMGALFGVQVPIIVDLSLNSWLLLVGFVGTGMLATSIYPTLMARFYNPRSIFETKYLGFSARWPQRILISIQYTSALVLLLWAFIAYSQVDFILGFDLGLNRANVIVVDTPIVRPSSYSSDFEVFMHQLRMIPDVRAATCSYTVMGGPNGDPVYLKGHGQKYDSGVKSFGGVDESFVTFFEIPIVAGRNFSTTGGSEIIISRFAAKRIGYPVAEEAIGEEVVVGYSGLDLGPDNVHKARIIGLIEDFRYRSLVNINWEETENETGAGIALTRRDFVLPGLFEPKKVLIRTDPDSAPTVIAAAKSVFSSLFPGNVFEYRTLDDTINEAYRHDKTNLNLLIMFALISVGIVCLGLLGLITTMVENRTKEMGIRKVLGAGMNDIGRILLVGVYRPTFPAIFISMPVSWYLISIYMERYHAKMEIQWWHYAFPILVLGAIMFVCVMDVLWRAVTRNPVESLRYE